MTKYTVKKGDTLSNIAKQYGTTYQKIAKSNGIADPNMIYEGQELNIGGSSAANNSGLPSVGNVYEATTVPSSAADMKFTYDAYEKSDTVRQAEALLAQHTANKPGDFIYGKQDQLDSIMDQYLNRGEFSYNLNEDALYQQYANQYAQMGKLAMMDTMGQAAAMTGGYGNSYAQSVGQQTYQGYLQQLNDKVPELYQMAVDQYNQEGDAMLNKYGLLSGERDQEYGVYRDQVSDYYAELEQLTENARYLSEDEYNKWLNDTNLKYGVFSDEKSYAYQADRDAVADEQWEWEKAQYERANSAGGESGGSGDGSGTGASGYELEHVATMSSEAIVNAMSNYQAAEDDTGLSAFLDDLVATNRISEATADQWYELYKTGKDPAPFNTTVYSSGDAGSAGGRRNSMFNHVMQ